MKRHFIYCSITSAMLALGFVYQADAARANPYAMSVAIVGQSNEAGAGHQPDPSVAPDVQHDPIKPWGGQRSMWPTLATLAQKHGVSMWFWNTGVGASSLVHSWAGTLRAWSPAMVLTKGDYVLYNGHVWKVDSPNPPTSLQQAQAAPGPAVGADGIKWRDMGPPQDGETVGRVFRFGDRLFDPNTYVAQAMHGPSTHEGDPWVFISIGQGDAGSYWSVTSDQYRDAIVSIADTALDRGYRVAIGFTCASARQPIEDAYRTKLLPAWNAALQHYSGDSRVVAGANLRLALGPLAITTDGSPGLQVDGLHMNEAAYSLASKAWENALVTSGIFPRAAAQ